jgi:RNA 2',3'-cyclic 3'-phosphodiesterase
MAFSRAFRLWPNPGQGIVNGLALSPRLPYAMEVLGPGAARALTPITRPSEASMRLFVALLMPESVTRALGQVEAELKGLWRGVRWVAPENLHVTLRFLGEVDAGRLGPVREALRVAAAVSDAFAVAVAGLGGFPSLRRPRVLWAGVVEGQEALTRLAFRMEEALSAAGFPKEERSFQAHVTLGRAKSSAAIRTEPLPDAWAGRVFGRFQAREFCLMESRLGPSAPIYRKVETFLLGPREGQRTHEQSDPGE